MSILSIKKYFVAETVTRFLVCLFPKVEKFNISAMYKSIFLIKWKIKISQMETFKLPEVLVYFDLALTLLLLIIRKEILNWSLMWP